MKISYALTASGGITTNQLNIAIFEENHEDAKKNAAALVAQLATSPLYYRFDLYEVAGENHVRIAGFSVDVPKPIVTIKT